MKLKCVLDHFGGREPMAEAIGVTRGAISHWITADGMPPFRAIQVEMMTGGKFKAADLIASDGGEE